MKLHNRMGKTLSRYELTVMTFIVSGYTAQQIAFTLHRSIDTIRSTARLSRHKLRLKYGTHISVSPIAIQPLIEQEWARLKKEKSMQPYETLEEILELADEIGGKIERGDLPPQDENGFYILP